MERTLASFAASGASPEERVRVARELARAVANLHARGRVHGALSPERALVVGDGAVVLAPAPAGEPPLARAGFDAPEIVRGGKPSPRSDAFALGALTWLALAGRPPFDAAAPLERLRCALFAEADPVRRLSPGVALEVEAAIAAALEKRPRLRASAAQLAAALAAAIPTATPIPTPTPPPPPSFAASLTPALRARSPRAAGLPLLTRFRRAAAPLAAAALAVASRVAPLLGALSPLQRAGLAAVPAVAIALALLPESDALLEREIAASVARGDFAAARRRLDVAAKRRPGNATVEKLRGDVACARGDPTECFRRYRVALAERPALREDETLRANARRLVRPGATCTTRRAAANLLGELRDPEALPALEEAHRSAGIFAYLCTGDSIERAILATRAEK
jgi:hypothetical protein